MIVKDFSDGKDRIQLGSGHKGLKLKTRGDDVYVYQRKDLMAVVEDAAGDLTRRVNILFDKIEEFQRSSKATVITGVHRTYRRNSFAP